jgi:transketolase
LRTAFFNDLKDIFRKDKRIMLLTGDLGYKLFDEFKDIDASRFINVGVAETNMIGIATGLASCGMKVYCYSIAPFLVMRTFEQIRNDIDWHLLDVKLVGVGGGLAYGLEGISHQGLEDIAILMTLPNFTIIIPTDPIEAGAFAQLSYEHNGPMYIRLCHTNEPPVHRSLPNIKIGKPIVLDKGERAVIFATGRMVYEALLANNALRNSSLKCTLIEVHTLKPVDKRYIASILNNHSLAITVEEHIIEGGLGSIVGEIIAENNINCHLIRLGVDRKSRFVGPADYLRHKYGLTANNIENIVRRELSDGAK